MKRVLLIGGSGQLGTEILRRWHDCEVAAPPHRELDLADRAGVRAALERVRPDAVVNCAAFADVDRCESEPEHAFEVNALAVAATGALAREFDAAFVTISTDYVFDGAAGAPYAESDAPHPLSVYGASKLAGELLVERLHSRAFVVRTCGSTAPRAPRPGRRSSNVCRRIRAMPSRCESSPTSSPSPTFAGHLADTLRRLIETESYGLYHAVDAGRGQLVRLRVRSGTAGGANGRDRADRGRAVEGPGGAAALLGAAQREPRRLGHRDAVVARRNCRLPRASRKIDGTMELRIDRERVARCRELAAAIVAPVEAFIAAHSTVSVERAVLRLLGVDGVTADEMPLPNAVLESLPAAQRGGGVALAFGRALAETGLEPQGLAEAIAAGRYRLARVLADARRRRPRRAASARRGGARADCRSGATIAPHASRVCRNCRRRCCT